MNISWLFDVDGVLCDPSERINPEFEKWFLDWSADKNIYLVTGSERSKTIAQIGSKIVSNAKISFHCLGNSMWIGNQEYIGNEFTLLDEERAWLENFIQHESKYTNKTHQHIMLRTGSINISVLGRAANTEQRAHYKAWDDINQERSHLVETFVSKFPRFEGFVGGDISIDVCLKGAGKSQVLKYMPDDPVYFFADRIHDNGVDKELADVCLKSSHNKAFQVRGYLNTQNLLMKSTTYDEI